MTSKPALQYRPFAEVPELEELRKQLRVNVPENERYFSILIGTVAMVMSFGERPLSGLLLAFAGGALVLRGASGHCALYSALGKPVLPIS